MFQPDSFEARALPILSGVCSLTRISRRADGSFELTEGVLVHDHDEAKRILDQLNELGANKASCLQRDGGVEILKKHRPRPKLK